MRLKVGDIVFYEVGRRNSYSVHPNHPRWDNGQDYGSTKKWQEGKIIKVCHDHIEVSCNNGNNDWWWANQDIDKLKILPKKNRFQLIAEMINENK